MNQTPRRRKKSELQIFKETRLPLIIVACAIVLILIFIIGAVIRAADNSQKKKDSQAAQQEYAEEYARLDKQCQELLDEAAIAATGYDYAGAIAILDRFEGNTMEFPRMHDRRTEYMRLQEQLVAWDDPSQIPNYSLQILITDPERAFHDDRYAKNFNKSFLTVEEFSRILDTLYANDYVLVSLEDIFTTKTTGDGAPVYVANTIYLPEGKKPFVLTQTNVNYQTYLVDSNDDKLPDAGGKGFANKLVLDSDGQLTNEYIDAQGATQTGSYDMIPILNAFVEKHPDFSYKGAKAVIALTGVDGLFGYRSSKAYESTHNTASEADTARKIAQKLTEQGYEIACYTYDNKSYGDLPTMQMEADLRSWVTEVESILPDVKIFAFAQNKDIAAEGTQYTDAKYNMLANAGFKIFLGYCATEKTWTVITDQYVRQGRILLTPQAIAHHPERFNNLLDATQILDSSRPEIPRD